METIKVMLASGVIIEDVGGEAVVYTSATARVMKLSGSSASLLFRVKQEGVVATALTTEVSILVDQGLLEVVSGMTRRGVVTVGAVAIGAIAMSVALPQAAAASSDSPPAWSGLWTISSPFGPDSDVDISIAFLAVGNFVGDNTTGPSDLASGADLTAPTFLWESGKGVLWADLLEFPVPDEFREDIVASFSWSTEYEVTFSYAEQDDWWEALIGLNLQFPPQPPP